MATYLLDTTVFSLLVKEHPGVRGRLATLDLTHRIVICTVVRGEVLYGLELMAWGKKRQDLRKKDNGFILQPPMRTYPGRCREPLRPDKTRNRT